MKFAAVFAVLFWAAAPPALAQPRPPLDPGQTTSDAALLKNEDKAIAELQQRLRNQVTYRNGLLVIIDRSGITPGVTVMPATAMWGIDCSENGLAVTFGAGSGDTDNGLALQLTSTAISDDECTRIAPAVGEALLDITKGN